MTDIERVCVYVCVLMGAYSYRLLFTFGGHKEDSYIYRCSRFAFVILRVLFYV